MKKIAVVTATRAEYGLLSGVIKNLREFEDESFTVDLIVTGTHLYKEYGHTIDEIKQDGLRIDYELDIPVKSDTSEDISYNQSVALNLFTKHFRAMCYDAVVLLGDRYETLAVAIAAGNTRTPIFHLCGGDTTEGAIDEWIRHAITKMSYLHFVTNEESKNRVIQLGEAPERVFNYGSTSIDNILNVATMTKEEALESVGMSVCDYAVCTYHPVTMEDANVDDQMKEFLSAIKMHPELEFIVTKSNADQGGMRINQILDEAADEICNLHVFSSLGIKRYLSLMKSSEFVLGNSSSGIIETPAFKLPTINIGDRQKGRLQSESIINCGVTSDEISDAINTAKSDEFKQVCAGVVSPYGDGNAAMRIARKCHDVVCNETINLKKKFYDLQV